jgi:ketosteroid isomerase-like protein
MSNANVTLVQNLYAAFQRGDIAPIIAALAGDVVWTVHGRPGDHPAFGVAKGPQGVQNFFGIIADTQTATDFSPREYDAAGDKVFVRGRYAWIIRKTAKPVSAEWVHIFAIKGGKVTSFDEFTDTAQFAEAIRD